MRADEYDSPIREMALYTASESSFSEEALKTAKFTLLDALGSALFALQFQAPNRLLGPYVPGTKVPNGSRVIGTEFILDPIQAAFQNGMLIRWLDYNDTFLAKEWGHPSDNLGAILSLTDYLCQKGERLSVFDLLNLMIKAYEIQGLLSLETSYNRVGFDHIALVKIASAAISAKLLGLKEEGISAAISNAFIDVGSLRTYRHEPNTGSRKSWAAADATSKGLFLAYLVAKGEMGYPTALSASRFGLSDALFSGKKIEIPMEFGSYVMENLLFKVSYPAEFHAQTAVEAAVKLHPEVSGRFSEIESIEIETQESGFRIINKKGPFKNPADRDHSLQYMVAAALIKGDLSAEDYEDEAEKKEPLIGELIKKMSVKENKQFSEDYLAPKIRSIANMIKINFKDGQEPIKVKIDFPLGHRTRRKEARPLIIKKFEKNTASLFSKEKTAYLIDLFQENERLYKTSVSDLVSNFIISKGLH